MSMLMKMIVNGSTGPMIMRKGGGGGGTSSSGIDPEFKPYLRKGLERADTQLTRELDEGEGARVAQLTASQEEGLGAQEALSREALQGTGRFDDRAAIDRQLDRVAAQGRLGQMGSPMNSARAQRAQASALADASLQLNQKAQQDAIAGAAGLQQAGATRRAVEQEVLDAPHKSLDRYFGYLSGAPQQTTSSQSGGK